MPENAERLIGDSGGASGGVAVSLSQSGRKGVLLGGAVLGLVVFVFGGSYWAEGGWVHEYVEWLGVCLIVFCILGRTWSSLYIAGRKTAVLVVNGPYSVSRNPLYFFSIVGAAGIGAQLGSLVLMVLAGAAAWLVFLFVIFKEEQVLREVFGGQYASYLDRVPRLLPKPSLWVDFERLEINPAMVLRTFLDACIFLVSIPIAEGFESLHEIGLIPVFFRLF